MLSDLPADVAVLFERAFAPSAASRPTAKEWEQGLAGLSQSLAQCPQDAGHKHVRGRRCPWCALNQGATAKGGFAPGAKRLDVQQELNRIWLGVMAIPVPAAPLPVRLPPGVAPLTIRPPALPVLEVLPLPERRLRAARTRRTLSVLLFGLLAVLLWRGGGIMLDLGVGLTAWILFANSNGKRIRAAHLRAQQDRHQMVIRQYEGEKNTLHKGLLTDSQRLQSQLSALYSRQQHESALAKYQHALNRAEARRKSVLALAAEEQTLLQGVREKHRKAALEQYLRRQMLTANEVRGIGPHLIANLNQKGVHSAWEINEQVRWIAGIGPKRAGELMLWRQTREGFFHFDPASVPATELAAAITTHDQKVISQLQLLSAEVSKFDSNVKTWRVLDTVVGNDIRMKLVEIEQHRLALQKLDEMWP